MPGMERIGLKFRENKVFVPQVLMSAKAMSTAMILDISESLALERK